MDVGLAAHRRRVAERFGDRLDNGLDADPLVILFRQQLLEGDDARAPGAEVLGGEIAAGRLADVVVDVARGDGLGLAVAVHILKQHLAGQLLAALDDPLQVAVGELTSWTIPCLPAKRISSLPPLALEVAGGGSSRRSSCCRAHIAHCRRGSVPVEQPDDGGETALASACGFRSLSTRRRSFGSALPNSRPSSFAGVPLARKSAW